MDLTIYQQEQEIGFLADIAYLDGYGNPHTLGWLSGKWKPYSTFTWPYDDVVPAHFVKWERHALPPGCYQSYLEGRFSSLIVSDGPLRYENSGWRCLNEPRDEEPDEQPPAEEPPPGGYSPILLDLKGDGVRTTGVGSAVAFDLNADGVNELLGWTEPSSHDAFLWVDLDRNRRVTDGSELFGTGTVLPNGRRAKDGFEALRVYDSPLHGGNGDGMITADDAIWEHFWLWDDSNHNGVSDPGEIAPILRHGVLELVLSYSENSTPDASGNVHMYRSSYAKRTPGRGVEYLAMEDVFFVSYP